jgi:hypothetical protein
MKEQLDKLTAWLGLAPDQQPLVFIGLGVVAAVVLALVFWIATRASSPSGARQGVFDRLGLSAFERRLVVAILVVLFGVLQWWFVFPEFAKWRQMQAAIGKGGDALRRFQLEMDRLPSYSNEVARLESEGHRLASEEVAVTLLRTVQNHVARTGVQVQNYNPTPPRPARGNEFFEEQALGINFHTTGDKELLDFLVAISADNSFLRVRDLTVKPDPTGQKLMGSVSIVASYQKAVAAKAPAANPRKL